MLRRRKKKKEKESRCIEFTVGLLDALSWIQERENEIFIMAKSLQKVHKQISKKRGVVDALHENSRDARRLRRAGARDDKLARVASVTAKARQSYVDRVAFFQENTKDISSSLTDSELAEIVNKFINRSVPEIEQLRQERRKGRPPSKREEALSQRTDMENKEFKTGFWAPDLTQEEVLKNLALWNGDWSSLSRIKFIRLTTDGTKHPSNFPPKGLS